MRQYIIKRLLLAVVTLFLVTFIVFALSRLIPGDVVQFMYAEKGYASDLQAMREKLGLTKPIYVQYFSWLGDIARLDFGESLWTKEKVVDEIGRRWPVTMELGLLALAMSVAMALPIGIISALKQDTLLDYALRSWAIGLLSFPTFWTGIVIIVVASTFFDWTPVKTYVGLGQDPGRNLLRMLIPAFALATVSAGVTMRITRTQMLEVLRQDYIRTAQSKGLRNRLVISRHALRNAMIPILTIIGNQVPFLVGGSIIIEQIFALPGLGRFQLSAIGQRDYPMIQGINLFLAAFVITLNLAVDMAYVYLDPRIRYR